MSFQQAAITSATPAKSLMDELKTFIDAHAAWAHVTTRTSGSITVEIYKCLGASNGVGDFYMAMRRTADNTTTVSIGCSEQWDGTLMGNVAPHNATNSLAVEADGSYGTDRDPLSAMGDTVGQIRDEGIGTLNTTGFTYWAVANARFFTAGVIGAGSPAYVGLYEPHNSEADPFPLCTFNVIVSTGSTSAGSATRDDHRAGTTAAHAFAFKGTAAFPPQLGYLDERLNKYRASRIALLKTPLAPLSGADYQYVGFLPDDLCVVQTTATESVGDLIGVDGVEHLCVTTSGPIWVNKSA